MLAREFFPDSGGRPARAPWRQPLSGVGRARPQGESMGFNSDEIAIIPIDYAQELFNTESLFRLLVDEERHRAGKAAITTS
jgi:putative ABC transport system permease protein